MLGIPRNYDKFTFKFITCVSACVFNFSCLFSTNKYPFKIYQTVILLPPHNVILCTNPFLLGGFNISRKGWVTGPHFERGFAGKLGVSFFFRGSCNFYIKNKLNLKYLMTKTVYIQECFSLQ